MLGAHSPAFPSQLLGTESFGPSVEGGRLRQESHPPLCPTTGFAKAWGWHPIPCSLCITLALQGKQILKARHTMLFAEMKLWLLTLSSRQKVSDYLLYAVKAWERLLVLPVQDVRV